MTRSPHSRPSALTWAPAALLGLATITHPACATGLKGTGGGTPSGPTIFTFTPTTGPIDSGATPGTAASVLTTDGGSVIFSSPQFTTGGDFVLKDASSATLLQGDFSSLQQFVLNSTSLFASFDVTYTGGSELTQAGFAPGDPGTLGLTLSGVSPGSGTGLQTASEYGMSFDVSHSAVPEPSAVLPFVLAGLGLGGLMLRARRRKITDV